MVQPFNPNTKISADTDVKSNPRNMSDLKLKIRSKINEISNASNGNKLTKTRGQIYNSAGMDKLFNKLPSKAEISDNRDAEKIAFCAQELKNCFAAMKEDVNQLSFDEVRSKIDPKITERLDNNQTKQAFRAAGFAGDI